MSDPMLFLSRMAETPILTSVLSFVRFVNFVVSLGEDLDEALGVDFGVLQRK
jgi:hypothetical protein